MLTADKEPSGSVLNDQEESFDTESSKLVIRNELCTTPNTMSPRQFHSRSSSIVRAENHSIFSTFLVIITLLSIQLISNAHIAAGQRIHSSQHDAHGIYTRRGSNATIACEPASRATKIYNLQWFKDDKKIIEIENDNIITWLVGEHASFVPETGALLLKYTQFTDSGDYLCVVNSKRDNGLVRLFVQDVPEPPGQPFVLSFTSRSLNLSWAPSINTHHSPVLNYIIHTRVGENGQWDENGLATLDNRTEFTIERLKPFTVYSFRVIAVNAIGASQPSKESFYTATLRENPDAMPIGFRLVNRSSTTLSLEWHPPAQHTIHGEFMGYRLRYQKNGNHAALALEREIMITNPNAKNYTLKGLEPFTEYLVTLRVFNPKGDGPSVAIAATTDEGFPSPVRSIAIIRVNDSTARIQFAEPMQPNGKIIGYHIYVHNIGQDRTEMRKFPLSSYSQHIMEFTIADLLPYTNYKVWIKAFTYSGEGEASRAIEFTTDVTGPSAPYIVNMTCEGDETLIVQWSRPETYYSKIDYYFVFYRSEYDEPDEFKEIAISPGFDATYEHDTRISNLTKGALYEVKVQGATRSMKESSKLFRGEFSDTRKVILQSYSASGIFGMFFSASMMAGVLCAGFAICLALSSFLLWRKYFQAAYYYLDDPAAGTGTNPRASPNLSEIFIDETDYPPVPVNQWSKHVMELHADSDLGFSKEYETLQRATEIHSDRVSSEHSHLVENKAKNRYVNIVAYDHSRVALKPLPGQKKNGGQDYINANYIDGYCKPQAYIGTQGPLPSTFDDYWRMIWEQRVCIVVMITNLMERGRHYLQPQNELLDDGRKCDQYWPKEGTETYGIVQVKLLQEVVMATYTLRTFHVKNLKIKKKYGNERTVYQYHYTNWPDHGVPDHPLPVLAFIRKSAAANPPTGGPIIVHCSAGVGRTGTYIVLDAMQRQIKHRGTINVYGFLKHIRQQRNYLVQTEEQYIFIHDALLEALEAGDTEVPSTHLLRYLQNLQTGGEIGDETVSQKHSHWSLLDRQFRMVTQFKAKDFNVVSALKPCNKLKNRSLNLIPLEAHRVHILPRSPGTEGSDYINATFLPGFSRLREFIITQHPVWDTVSDFWQMVWDHNVQTIVMLSAVIDEKEFPQFWPDRDDEADYGSFKVKLTEESRIVLNDAGAGLFITKRDLMLQSTQDDYEMCCRIVHCSDWPERQPLAQVFDLVRVVQEWCNSDSVTSSGVIGPVVVVDKFGGTEAATFAILTTLFKQLNFEDCVDVYMYAKLYHLRRPGIWRSQDDYLFLYRALEALVSANSSVNGYNPPTPPSGFQTSNANTLTSTSSATHLMGSSTPPIESQVTSGHYTLPRSERGASRSSSHKNTNAMMSQSMYNTINAQNYHNHHLQQQQDRNSNSGVSSSHRTPSPYMCDSPQQLISVHTGSGNVTSHTSGGGGGGGYSSYQISMIPSPPQQTDDVNIIHA